MRIVVPGVMGKSVWLGVAAVAAVAASGAFGGSGGGTITTIAGTGQWGYSGGDGGRGASAQLWLPRGVAVDAKGNVYVADTANNRVRKVDARGTISTIAGTGKAGFSGDGGPGAAARLSYPDGVAVDGKGNVYIADFLNSRVRKVSPGGKITTIAGTGKAGFSGDGGPATSAQLYGPVGVAVDAQGNVYIYEVDGDLGISRVRKVSRGGTITTFAGTGRSGFSGDGGPATSAQLSHLGGVAVDAKGNVYIADYGNQRVRRVDIRGTIATIAGTGAYGFSGDGGPATRARLYNPYGVAADGKGNVYIADFLNSRVRKVSPGGKITTIAGTGREGFSGDGGPATSAQLFRPEGLAADRNGNVYVADTHNNRVRKISAGLVRATSPKVSSVSGRCSKATALRVAARFQFAAPAGGDQLGKVLCGAFVGPGSKAMVVAITPGTCGINGWAVFSFAGGAWRLIGPLHPGWVMDIAAVGSDIRETAPVPTGVFRCPTSGTPRSRIWHWNGTRLVASRWTQTKSPAPATKTVHLYFFFSPSHNISCSVGDEGQASCVSRNLPHSATLSYDGTVTICNGPTCVRTPRPFSPGDPVLGYGQRDQQGRLQCTSETKGITCTLIGAGKGQGKGFLINRDGVSRVGP